jgi:hypothetical protein
MILNSTKVTIIDVNTPWIREFSETLSRYVNVTGFYVKPFVEIIKLSSIYKEEKIYFFPKYYSNFLSSFIFKFQLKYRLFKEVPNFLIITSPFYRLVFGTYNGKKIYYAYDNYRFFNGWNSQLVDNFEKRVTEECDLILVSSNKLREFFIEKYNLEDKKVIHFPNATKKEFIFEESTLPSLSKTNSSRFYPIAGCIGNIDENRTDLNLILKLAKQFSNVTFEFYGGASAGVKKNTVFKEIMKLPNVRMHGSFTRNMLKNILNNFNVYLVPFLMTPFNYYCCPVRIFDYIASGRPIISINIPEIEYLFKKYVYLANNHDEFIDIFRELYKKDFNDGKNIYRLNIAYKHTWDTRSIYFLEQLKRL